MPLSAALGLQRCDLQRMPVMARLPSPQPLCPWQRGRIAKLATRYQYGAL